MPGSTPERQAALYLRRRITRRTGPATSISGHLGVFRPAQGFQCQTAFRTASKGFLQIHYLFLGCQPVQRRSDRVP